MELLNTKKELDFIRLASMKKLFLGNGSSRAVYDLGNGYCLKVAPTTHGQRQNKVEADFYKEHGSSGLLADIVAVGKHTLIMKTVKIYNSRDMVDAWDDEPNQITKTHKDASNQINKIVTFLRCKLGTSDGLQIGFIDNKAVCYDYGYLSTDTYENVGKLRSFINKTNEYKPLEIVKQKILDSF